MVTNPYEGTSPVVNLPGSLNIPGVEYVREYGTPSPLGPKVDEGYISQGPNKSPDIGGVKGKGLEFAQQPTRDDPFYTPKNTRHLSGMSQGMGSPLYDAATGEGMDRIESKDIYALMQHVSSQGASVLSFTLGFVWLTSCAADGSEMLSGAPETPRSS